MVNDLTQRLIALANAHELVDPTLKDHRSAVSLDKLLAVLLGAYDDVGAVGDRIRVDVPLELRIGEGSITTFALVVHELATNSLKYGALSRASGTLYVSCAVEDEEAVIVWAERGGAARCRRARGARLRQQARPPEHYQAATRDHRIRLAAQRGACNAAGKQVQAGRLSVNVRVSGTRRRMTKTTQHCRRASPAREMISVPYHTLPSNCGWILRDPTGE
jgi:anti-sigma regulatory factor (Ser/Thr protein kinase)